MNEATVIEPQQTNGAGTKESSGFGTTSLEKSAEVGASALVARATAEVQAPYVMAERKPRDWDTVRAKILHECKRTSFAESALYRKPVGGQKIEGLSVRFAETAMRCMTNLSESSAVIHDDPEKRIIRVTIVDLESNVQFSDDVTVPKTVERKHLGKGQKALASRANSYGDTVYLVHATDDETLNKANAGISKALRNNVLRILPGDIKEEALTAVRDLIKAGIQQNPDAARKKIVDAFLEMGVKPLELKEYVGKELDALTPEDIESLRGIFTAIKDRETTWKDIMSAKVDEGAGGKVEDLAERAKKKNEEKKAAVAAKVEEVKKPIDADLFKKTAREPGEEG
jgi:hypothetical protein